ncbi:MAG: nuclear transport factor 2 family protein [Actinomycetota bacterium]|nr:nuclear transport factor 2 family protein [Actinomycetota bacterium]
MTAPGWQPLIDARDACADPATRQALDLVARHVVAEVAGDIEGVLATLVAEPTYRIWGASSSAGPVGAEQVRRFYDDLVGSGKNRLDYVLTRVVADRTAVVTEGAFHHVYDGRALAGKVAEHVVPGSWYHVAYQALVVWPVSEGGLLLGEDIYAGEPARVLGRIEPDELAHLGPTRRG